MAIYIGADLGTSSVKLTAANDSGKILAESQREYALDCPHPGWKEIDPKRWTDALDSALQELLDTVGRSEIRGIGVTGQMHTVVPLDRAGQPVRPALMWNDLRTADLVDELNEALPGTAETEMIRRILSTGSPAANLYWIKKNEPENYRRISSFLIAPDYIVYYLTGIYGTDYCEASTSSLYDIVTREWSEPMRSLLGLSADAYPDVKGACTKAGVLRDELKKHFGLEQDVYVVTGTGDNPAAAIATGCLDGGYPVFSIGTSGVVMFPRKKLLTEAKGKNILFSKDGVEFSYLVQGGIQSAGSSFQWLTKDLLHADSFTSELDAVDPAAPDDGGVMFYPHLLGDKTLYADPSLKGAFFGLSTDTSRANLIIAVMEGISFAARELFEAMQAPEEFDSVRVIGGGSKSPVWMQIIADIFGMPAVQLSGKGGAGLGAAILSMEADGIIPEFSGGDDGSENDRIYIPNAGKSAEYEEKYRKYRRIHQALCVIG